MPILPKPPAVVAAAIESATFVIAASNSEDPTRADVQCSGAADQVEINAAIAALPAGVGGTVFLLEGTYVLSGSIVILRDNVTLMGSGTGTVLSGVIAAHFIEVGNGATALTGIVIRNLSIDGTSQTAGHGVYFHGGDGHLITYSWVAECYIHDTFSHGIQLEYTEDILVENNIIEGTPDGIQAWVSNNRITIVGNTLIGNATGIMIGTNNNTIVGNTCSENDYAISLTSSSGNTVSGNTCQGNEASGIQLYNSSNNNTITGNTCQGNLFHGGIWIHSSSGNTVSGNTCQGNTQHGIYLNSSSNNNTITGNTCIENVVGNTGTYDGINIDDGDENLVIGNTCNLNGRYGINISGARNWVENNILIGNTTGAFNDGGTGTKLAEVHVNSIFDDSDVGVTLGNIGDHVALSMANEAESTIRFNFRVPSNFQELVRARLVVVPAANGDLRRAVAMDWGVCDEVYNVDGGAITEGTVTGLTLNQLECLDLDAALTGIAAGDHVGVAFTRDATHAEDTIEEVVYVLQFWMQYV